MALSINLFTIIYIYLLGGGLKEVVKFCLSLVEMILDSCFPNWIETTPWIRIWRFHERDSWTLINKAIWRRKSPKKISFEVVSIKRPTTHSGCQWSFTRQGCIRWLQDIKATVRVQTTYVLDGLILVAYYPRKAVFFETEPVIISKVSIWTALWLWAEGTYTPK